METHVTQYIKIPRFDPKNELHKRLAACSRKAHELAAKGAEEELRQVEDEIDRLMAQLYGLFDEELQDVRHSLALLKGEEVEEEIEEIELPVATKPDILFRNNVVDEGKPFKVEVIISNPTEELLKNMTVKLSPFDKRTIEEEFDKVEDSVSFSLDFPGLSKGQYKVKASVSYEVEGASRKLERDLTIYVKGGKEPKHIERAVKLEDLFKE